MKKIAIIGAGLSGLTMAYNIKKNCGANVVIFEKGKCYIERIEVESNELLCGEGGAGTVFGGKLCFPPASSGVWLRSKLNHIMFEKFTQTCVDSFVPNKNIPKIVSATQLYHKRENLFFKDYESVFLTKSEMRMFVGDLIDKVKDSGTVIYNKCEFLNYVEKNGKFYVKCSHNELKQEEYEFDYLVFASGRWSSDSTLKWLSNHTSVTLQNPDLGIRFSIKHKDSPVFENIGKDVKIKAKLGNIGVRTFCVCSGGNKTSVDLKGTKYYDGHFDDKITNEVNMGVLARSPYIFGYEGAALFCSCLKDYLDADFSLKDFMKYSHRMIKETNIYSDVLDSINCFLNMLKQEHIIDENLDKYPVWLPSVDRLNPIIWTNHNFETATHNLYVIGDAVGISRGFVQSMWSAYCASEDIIKKVKGQEYKEKMII